MIVRMTALRGRRQRGNSAPRTNLAQVDPDALIQTGFRLRGSEYIRAHQAAEAAGLSLSGYIGALINRDQVDENGRPLWAEPDSDQLSFDERIAG